MLEEAVAVVVGAEESPVADTGTKVSKPAVPLIQVEAVP